VTTTPSKTAMSEPVYGKRGCIGVIDLSTCTSLTAEYQLAIPDGVLAIFARLRLPRGEVSVEALDEMVSSPRLEEAAQELADAGASVIVFACTTGSLLHGPGFDRTLAERIEKATDVPATTTATAVLNALQALGTKALCIGTPYVDELNRRERLFFEAAGLSVLGIKGLGLHLDRDIGRLSAQDVKALAQSANIEGTDALFLSCTNLPALPFLAELEVIFGKPVLSSNAATIWETLRLIDALPAKAGFGALLSSPPHQRVASRQGRATVPN
jgi:maleate isomerase